MPPLATTRYSDTDRPRQTRRSQPARLDRLQVEAPHSPVRFLLSERDPGFRQLSDDFELLVQSLGDPAFQAPEDKEQKFNESLADMENIIELKID